MKKRPAPLSLRLTGEERARLEAEANGTPLGAYIKSKVFGGRSGSGYQRSIIQDYELLAQVLAAMGRSELFANLDVLTRQVENGSVTLSPDAEYEIELTCACVLQMRDDLIYALGLRSELNE